MFVFLLSDREGKKTLNSVYGHVEILKIVPNATFLLSLGCLCSNPDRKTRITFCVTYLYTYRNESLANKDY